MDKKYEKYLKGLDEAAQERLVRDRLLDTLRRFGRRIPFARDALASYFAMLDPKVPAFTRAAVVAPLAYLVIPTDLIPDFLAGFGFTDDAFVFWAAFKALQGKMEDRHYERADEVLELSVADEGEAA